MAQGFAINGNIIVTGQVSSVNSSTTPLNNGQVFTGTLEDVSIYPAIVVSCYTDQSGQLQVQFSTDGTNWDSTLTYTVDANVNDVHRLTVTRRYARVVFTNNSGANQTFFRLQTLLGSQQTITTALNGIVQQDSDSIVTRSVDAELAIAANQFTGFSIVNKFGLNPDVDTATVPEDIWGGGGTYTGFPDSTLETLAVSSSDANDTSAGTGARTIRITGLDSNYNIISETVTLNGVATVNTVNQFRRAHTAQTLTAGSGGVNAGTITITHTTTTGNVFLVMLPGRNQTNNSAYTVPAGYTAYLRSMSASCSHSTAVSIDGNIWTRSFGSVFRSRRPFYIGNTLRIQDNIYGGIVFTEKSDIIIRINTCSANNIPVNAGYDLILIKN